MAIKVINHLKDGTIVEDMSTVTVPKEIVERVAMIVYGNSHPTKTKSNTEVQMMKEGLASETISRANALKKRWMYAWMITFIVLIVSNLWRIV